MSIAVQIVCDGCGTAVSGGAGKDRKHAHVIRAELARGGWNVSGAPDGDLCPACRPLRRRTRAVGRQRIHQPPACRMCRGGGADEYGAECSDCDGDGYDAKRGVTYCCGLYKD